MLKAINGQRHQLETALVESLCLGDIEAVKQLVVKLDSRATLTLMCGQAPSETALPRQSDEAPA